MPVTMGPVPGLTSGLRRVSSSPGHFRNGRWFLLVEGVLVSAFGIAGLVPAAVHSHAGPTGGRVLGLDTTPVHSAILLALGALAIAAVGNRRAAVTVTALSAVAYTMLLFFGSVATARRVPTPLGFHAADIVLHGVLAVVNLALLMWMIPDELGGPEWVPRRRQGRHRYRRQPSAAAPNPGSPAPAAGARTQESNPPVSVPPAPRALPEQPNSRQTNESPPHNVAARAPDAVLARGAVVPVVVAVLAAVVVIVIWRRRRRGRRLPPLD